MSESWQQSMQFKISYVSRDCGLCPTTDEYRASHTPDIVNVAQKGKVKTFTIKSKELKYGKWVSISSHKITPAMNDEKVSQVSLTSEGNEETGKAIPSLSF